MKNINLIKYNKYKYKNNQESGNLYEIKLDNIKNENFIKWITEKTKKYFGNNNGREYGGIISFSNNSYELIESKLYDKNSSDMIWPIDMLDNMNYSQIIWHTHNIERGNKCEPPSGADFSVLLQLAKKKSKYPFAIAIHKDGIWIYKLKQKLNEEYIKNFEKFNNWVFWTMNAIGTVYCSPKIKNNMEGENLKKFGITNMKTDKDYKDVIIKVFKNLFFTDFISFNLIK